MRRGKLMIMILLIGVTFVPLESQRRGGGGGGGGRNLPPGISSGGNPQTRRNIMEAIRALPIADIWTELTLGMEIGQEKASQLRLVLTEAYKQRKALLEEAREEDSWAYTKAQMQKLERELWPKINVILTRKEQRRLDRGMRTR